MTYKSSARFITGFCGGMFVLAAPAYSSEIAEAKYRGALGSLMQVMVCLSMQYSTVQYSTVQHSTVQHSTVQLPHAGDGLPRHALCQHQLRHELERWGLGLELMII